MYSRRFLAPNTPTPDEIAVATGGPPDSHTSDWFPVKRARVRQLWHYEVQCDGGLGRWIISVPERHATFRLM